MKQIALLEAIQAQGSISGAARALRLSYAGARLLIEGIHKILCEPAVSGLAGGRSGGGTTLTPVGTQLIFCTAPSKRAHKSWRWRNVKHSMGLHEPKRLIANASASYRSLLSSVVLPECHMLRQSSIIQGYH